MSTLTHEDMRTMASFLEKLETLTVSYSESQETDEKYQPILVTDAKVTWYGNVKHADAAPEDEVYRIRWCPDSQMHALVCAQ